jgi:lipopolysaccharide export LptBFGC system permease protein LptF
LYSARLRPRAVRGFDPDVELVSMRLQLHVLRELVVAISFTLGGMIVLALPAVAVSAIHQLQGVQISAILLYLPLLLAGLLPYLLPLAFLLGTVSTFGRLAQDNEWTAIRMTGRHPLRILVPGFLMALGLSGTTFWMVSEVLPRIRTRQSQYLVTSLSAAVRELNPGRTDVQFGDFYLTARRREGKAFVDAQVYVPPIAGHPARHLRADRIDVRVEEPSILLLFKNARAIVGGTEVQNGDMKLRIDLEELRASKEGRFDNMRYLSSPRIRAELAGGASGEREQELRYELHYRMSLASVFGVFLLLGTATGLSQSRGNQLKGLAAAAGYALAFYLLHMRLGKQLADKGVLPPELCAWTAIAIGLVVGVWLCGRTFRR